MSSPMLLPFCLSCVFCSLQYVSQIFVSFSAVTIISLPSSVGKRTSELQLALVQWHKWNADCQQLEDDLNSLVNGTTSADDTTPTDGTMSADGAAYADNVTSAGGATSTDGVTSADGMPSADGMIYVDGAPSTDGMTSADDTVSAHGPGPCVTASER